MIDNGLMPTRRAIFGAGAGLAMTAAWPPSGITAARTSAKDTGSAAENRTHYRSMLVENVEIFYREAGRQGAPVVVLLHGFPTSSRMYRDLMPILADRYHVIAPDYPAFGHSAVPSRTDFAYTHAHLSAIMGKLIDQLGIGRYALYCMDFGGPIGYRLLLRQPERVQGVIAQNTPVFSEPTDGPIWSPLLAF